jgi:phospholipid transport system substrate-binding protein
MLTRRSLLLLSGASVGLLTSAPVWAQAQDPAATFVQQTGQQIVGIINQPGSLEPKMPQLRQIIDRTVDVNGVARFCLGRYWRQASPQQQQEYLQLFHEILVHGITNRIGDYKNVQFTIGRTTQRDGDSVVRSTMVRPGNPPNEVDWVISNVGGTLKVVDMVAEGTSLRLTQRSDYASYLARNGNNVQALIDALRNRSNG